MNGITYMTTIESFEELESLAWSGGEVTLSIVSEANKEEELMGLLCNVFESSTEVTLTSINDFLWHESSFIFQTLGLGE